MNPISDKDQLAITIKKLYRRFARFEARGVSKKYEEFANSVADSDAAIQFLGALPEEKQQPNLLLGALRKVCGVASSGDDFCRLLFANTEQIRSVMLAKSTQTNEPGRCATLLPVLSTIDGPIALLEVGASAGLCLYPDRYGYAYGDHELVPQSSAVDTPTFLCDASSNTPLPESLPEIVWRGGLDLNPLDVANNDDVDWLKNLIWPEQVRRLENISRAIAIARTEPPHLMKGDLLEQLPVLAGQAPANATLVVFHSAVLAYVRDKAARDKFAATVLGLDAIWISNEHPRVFPEFASGWSSAPPDDQFLLSVDGNPVATTGPHGQSITWL